MERDTSPPRGLDGGFEEYLLTILKRVLVLLVENQRRDVVYPGVSVRDVHAMKSFRSQPHFHANQTIILHAAHDEEKNQEHHFKENSHYLLQTHQKCIN